MKKLGLVKVVGLTLAVTTAFAFGGCGSKKNYTENNTTYHIGASGPLTGGAAVYGLSVKKSAQLAVDEINQAGGLDGVMFSFDIYDDVHDQTKVKTGYNSQLEKGMQVSLGCVTTKPCLQYTNLSKKNNVFFITPSATGDDVPKNDNGYQMCFCDSSQGTASAKYVKEHVEKTTKIGVFYKIDDNYSKGIFDSFKKDMGDNWGGYDVTVQYFDNDHATDFDTQVTALKDCKFIFMPIYYGPASAFMRKAKGLVADDAIYFGADGFDGIEGSDGLGDDLGTMPQAISYISHFDSKATEGKAKTFIDAYKAKYNNEMPIQFGASAYDCVYAIYEAMKQAKQNGKEIPVTISAGDLCEILKEVFQGGFTFTGVTGNGIKWQKDGKVDANTKVCTDYVIKEAGTTK